MVVGGPTTVLDLGGLRILSDPTFDAPGPHGYASRSWSRPRVASFPHHVRSLGSCQSLSNGHRPGERAHSRRSGRRAEGRRQQSVGRITG